MKTSQQDLYFGRTSGTTGSNNSSRRIVPRGQSSSTQDAHARRLELVRAEVAENLVRQRLLSFLKLERETNEQFRRKKEAKEEPVESAGNKVLEKRISPFPTEDEGVDFSWIYNSGMQYGLNYDAGISEDCNGIELVLKPFRFNKSADPVLEEVLVKEETTVVMETLSLPKTSFPVNVDVKLRRIDISPESGNISDDRSIIYGTESESESDEEFFDDDDF